MARPAGSQNTYRHWATCMSATSWRAWAAGRYPHGGISPGCSSIPSRVPSSIRTSGAAHRVADRPAAEAAAPPLGITAPPSLGCPALSSPVGCP